MKQMWCDEIRGIHQDQHGFVIIIKEFLRNPQLKLMSTALQKFEVVPNMNMISCVLMHFLDHLLSIVEMFVQEVRPLKIMEGKQTAFNGEHFSEVYRHSELIICCTVGPWKPLITIKLKSDEVWDTNCEYVMHSLYEFFFKLQFHVWFTHMFGMFLCSVCTFQQQYVRRRET